MGNAFDKYGSMEGFNKLPQTEMALQRAMSAVVRKACFDIQARAQAAAPVQTGMLKNSIYTVVRSANGTITSGYDTALGKMLNKGHDVASTFDEAQLTSVQGAEGVVAVGANYGIYVEYGTSNMAAHPYLMPAYEAVKAQFEQVVGNIEDYFGAGGEAGIDVTEE